MKNRNPITVFLLSVITLGLYDIYWLVQTKKVLNAKTRFHTPSIWLLISPLVLLIAGYIAILFSALSSNSEIVNGTYTTTSSSNAGLNIFALAALTIGIISFFLVSFIWFFKFSKAINAYTQGKMSTGVSFLILYLIHLIGVAIIQDAFNDMSEAGEGGGQLPPQPVAVGPSGQYAAAPSSFTPTPMTPVDQSPPTGNQGPNQSDVASVYPSGNYPAPAVPQNPPAQSSVTPPAGEAPSTVLPPTPNPTVNDVRQHQI